MKQIALEIALPTGSSFDNFYVGSNQEVLQHLQTGVRSLHQAMPRSPVPTYLWGPHGSGKSHLLHAVRHALGAHAARVGYLPAVQHPENELLPEFQEAWAAVLLDDVHLYNAQQQHIAFNWFVNAQTHQCWVLAAGALPPTALAMRDDLRTRLASGYTLALQALNETQCRSVLQHAAHARGVLLSAEVIDYMLTRFSRDLGSLMELLAQLDAYALETQRAITVPLIRAMMENS